MSFTFTPIAIVGFRLAPLLINTFTLQFSLDEHMFLSQFPKPTSSSTTPLNPSDPTYAAQASAFLPAYFTHWLKSGQWMIILGYPPNITLGLANLLLSGSYLPSLSSSATKWYTAGVVFTIAHLLFAPQAVRLLAEIRGKNLAGGERKRKSTEAMAEWLRMNALRSFTTDLPAWICNLVGFVQCMAAVL